MSRKPTEPALLRRVVQIAAMELKEQNEDYGWRTPKRFMELITRAHEASQDELIKLVSDLDTFTYRYAGSAETRAKRR